MLPRDLQKRVKNIAPKARIIKNVVVLGCSSMFYCGCIMPLRTYLSLSPDCGNVASIALSLLYVVSASSSLLYGTFVARQLTHKVTLLLTYVPFMLFIPGVIYYKHYVLLPAAIVIGLTQGPYFNALYAYLFNSAARFSYLSFETVCHSAHRFLCIFHLLTHCGWAWGFLLSAGTLHGIESTTNETHMPWTLALSDRKGRHYQEGSKNVANQITWSALGAVNPWYAFSLYFGWIGLSVLLTLLLLDRLQVHFYANKEKASARELLLANVHLIGNARLKRLIPLFICIGINEVFVVADVMQAYVACVSPQSTVGYVLFCYSLTNLFMSAFIHTAAFHVSRMTFLWVGFITQAGILLVMWLWVPSKDDQAVFYVIVMTWGFSHRIWRTFGERMVYEAFPDNWDSSFTIYHVGCTVGMSIGFLMKPFGKTEYKIYTVGFVLIDASDNGVLVKLFEDKAAQCLQQIKEDGELKLLRDRAMADIQERGGREELFNVVSKLGMNFIMEQQPNDDDNDPNLTSRLQIEMLQHLEESSLVNEKLKSIVERQLSDPSFQSLIIKIIRKVAQSQTDDETVKAINTASHDFPGFAPRVKRQRNSGSSVLFKLNLSSISATKAAQQVPFPNVNLVDSTLKQPMVVPAAKQLTNQTSQYPSYSWFPSRFPPPMPPPPPPAPSLDSSRPPLPFNPQLPHYIPTQNINPFMLPNLRLPNPFFQAQ
ncbi:hypothetical protein TTRE_0000438601 [Trichuris trichiura]|uniref:Uncharacterized protein n=1 Tax=Trichuris trichiura TaxID=36087 RepID=A0A077Z7D2_TRITR|nr:hypothetical protein TTRE_0000438601 [Trichuris trichiura]